MRPAVIRAFSVGAITGSFLTAAAVLLATPAKADSVVYAYASTFGAAVCATLDDFPSFEGILGVASAIVNDGLTNYQAGEVIGLSIAEICPRHTRLMVDFVKQFGSTESVA